MNISLKSAEEVSSYKCIDGIADEVKRAIEIYSNLA